MVDGFVRPLTGTVASGEGARTVHRMTTTYIPHPNLTSRKKAFTMVELIIVIVVLAVLSTIAVAGYRYVVDRAKDAKAEQTVSDAVREAYQLAAFRSDGTFTDDDMTTATSDLGPQVLAPGVLADSASNGWSLAKAGPASCGGPSTAATLPNGLRPYATSCFRLTALAELDTISYAIADDRGHLAAALRSETGAVMYARIDTHGTLDSGRGQRSGQDGDDTAIPGLYDTWYQPDAWAPPTTTTPAPSLGANADTYTTAYAASGAIGSTTSVTVDAGSGVLANDTGVAITVSGHTDPAHGSLSLAADGSFNYTAPYTYAGSDSFSYTVTDVAGQTATATVIVTVTPPTPPTAVAGSVTTSFDTPVTVPAASGLLVGAAGTFTGNANPAANLTVTGHSTPAYGTVTTSSDGGYTYTPALSNPGTDSFTYTITDVVGQTATATVSVTVLPVNYLPTGSLTVLDPDTVTGTLTFGAAPAGVTQQAEWSTYVANTNHVGPPFQLGEFGPSTNIGTTAVWTPHGQCDTACSANDSSLVFNSGIGVPLSGFVKITNSTGACQVYTVTARISEGWMPQSGAATFSTTITNFGAGGYTHPNVTAPTCGSPIGADTHPAVPTVTPAAAPTPTNINLAKCSSPVDTNLGTPCWKILAAPTPAAHHSNLIQWNTATYEKISKPSGGFWVGSATGTSIAGAVLANSSGNWTLITVPGTYNSAGLPATGRPTAYGALPSVFTTWVKTSSSDFTDCKLFKVTVSTTTGLSGATATISAYTPGQDVAADPYRTISCP